MLIIDGDAEFAGRLGDDAEARRMRHRIATDAEEVRAALSAEPPDVVVLDLQFGGTAERGLALIAEVARCAPRARILVVSGTGGYEERLEVARRGGRAFIQKPAVPARVLEAAAEMLGTADGAIRRVLVVDDDPALLGMVVEQLRGPRLEVATLDSPLHFWETLERTRPDVLLIDENMPMLSGGELCAVLRGDPRWAGLPVLFITASADVETVRRVFAAGADDYVAKPFAGPELRTRIEGRVERQRLQRVIAEQDPLTGVANRRMTGHMLDQMVSLASKQRQPVSVALIDMDRLGEVNDVHGETAGDVALRSAAGLLVEAMGADEALGRWSGDAFLAGFSTDAEETAKRLRDVLERLRAGGLNGDGGGLALGFSAGVASCPVDGHDLRALMLSARQALSEAREEGAGVIRTTGRSTRDPSVTEMVDVVLSGLLGHTLETRGHSTRVISDGGEAIAALCGPSPRLRARVIILDVDLPGRDGFEVLRSLAGDNVTAHSRVVMLTVRATEPEVVRALELGAFDHIAKPFSVQILMQRLRRALGE
jgi:diguanylate cyclase (GGDEF)-like protein